MAQEDQSQKYSNGSSGENGGTSRSSKELKQKKLPQRGLGVAQLEKIRLEEQQNKDSPSVPCLSPRSSISSTNKSSHMPMSNQNLLHSNNQSSSILFPSPSPSDFSSPNSIIKAPLIPVHNMDCKNSITVPLTNQVKKGVPEAASPSLLVHDNVSKYWNSYEYDFEKDDCGLDPGLAFRYHISLPYESNPILPLPDFTHRAQHHQPSMVNVSPGISSSSRSLYAIEPPSNQRYNGNCKPMLPEEKVVSLKRPYPFPMDNPSGSYFSYKLPTFAASERTDETVSYGNRSASNFDGGNSVVREGLLCSASLTESNSKNSNSGTRIYNGDFLTLAPPTISSFCLSSNFKQPPTFKNYEYPDFESLPYQGSVEDPNLQPASLGRGFSQERPFYCFLPVSTMPEPVQTTSNIMKDFINEMGENADLNLKL